MINQFKDKYRWLSNFWFFDTPMKYPDGEAVTSTSQLMNISMLL
ncbi:hypothetical protein VP277E431_P0115 [Vibrio phage 277E43-1]|nr:hypothetical protein VP277E431_P0115 [Vibrio phage 277E43-1]